MQAAPGAMAKQETFNIGEVTVDPARGEFVGPRGRVHVEPLVMDLILYLARRPGELVTREVLIQALWEAYPGADQSLSNTASKLRAALDAAGGDRAQLHTVPKRGFRLAGPVIAEVKRRRRQVALASGIAALLLAVAAVVVFQFRDVNRDQISLAVLAFDDLSPAGDHEYLAHGLAEEILGLLGSVPRLNVVGRTSSFAFDGTGATIPEIGRRLGVSHILEGSIRASDDKVRITVQLLEARRDEHLWTRTYERELADLFATEDEVAADIAAQLKLELLPRLRQRPATDPETYALYLKARYLLDRGNMVQGKRGRGLLETVLERDPDYVPALTTAARLAGNDSRSEELLQRALTLEPDNPAAHAFLAWRRFKVETDPPGAARLMERALENPPASTDVLRFASRFSRSIGRFEEGLALAQLAVERDPLCGNCLYELSLVYLYSGRLKDAEYTIRRYHDVAGGGRITLGDILMLRGDADAALRAYAEQEPPVGHEGAWLTGQAMALYTLGRREEFDAVLAKLSGKWGEEAPCLVARVHAWAGDRDAAFEWLSRGIDACFHLLVGNPFFHELHDDPRWSELLRPFRLDPENLREIEFNPPLA